MSAPKHNLFGTGKGKAPVEKSSFTQTCNRLSLFLKEKRNLRDFSLAKFDPKASFESPHVITPTPTTAPAPVEVVTYELLNNVDNKKVSEVDKVEKQVKFLPQYIILDDEPEDCATKASPSKPKTAQMTIFYDGKVVVLDDVPEDRANSMMIEASGRIDKPIELASTSLVEMKESDLPIARRASLNKFLAKRKERAIVRAPYQVHNMNMNMSPGPSSSGNEYSFDLNM